VLDLVHGRANPEAASAAAPAAAADAGPDGGANNSFRRAVRLQRFLNRPALVAAVAVAAPDASVAEVADAPVVMSVKFIDDEVLSAIASSLLLRDLRQVEKAPAGKGAQPDGAYVFDLVDGQGQSIARFAWVPKRPGAEIVHSVVPFIAVALAGFALLAALVFGHMRRTAAASSRLARPALRPAQPHLFRRAARSHDREGAAGRPDRGRVLHRSRPLQGRQRYARSPGRRRTDPQRHPAAVAHLARRRSS